MKPHVAEVGHLVQDRFDVDTVYGYRPSAIDRQGHPAGLALDFMVPVRSAQGDEIAAYLLAHQDEFAVKYVIWDRQLNYGSGWSLMEDRGGITANHYDHVHVTFEVTSSGASILC